MEISAQDLDFIPQTHTRENAVLDGRPMTMRSALARVADTSEPGMTQEEATKAAELVDRIIAGNGNLELKAEEVARLVKRSAIAFTPFIFQQIYEILEPPVKPELKEVPRSGEAAAAS